MKKIKKILFASELVVLVLLSAFVVSLYLDWNHSRCSETLSAEEVNQPPTVFAAAKPASGKEPLAVSFHGFGNDRDGTIVSYHWDFDDGTISDERNPTHVFQKPGPYLTRLTVTDDEGETAHIYIVIKVNKNKPRKAQASAYKSFTHAPTSIYFKGSGTDEDGEIVSYQWTGCVTSDAPEASTYAWRGGTYRATFTVTDDNGATDAVTVSVYVWDETVMSCLLQPLATR